MTVSVLCLGDSHTEGVNGANWVSLLCRQWRGRGVNFRNAGYSGYTAHGILKVLEELRCQPPDGMTLLAGTNDVLSTVSPSWEWWYRWVKRQVTTPPSLQGSIASMEAILKLMAERAPKCRIAVMTIPPLSEDLGHPLNDKVVQYNGALKRLLAAHPDVKLVDLYAACEAQLRQLRDGGATLVPVPPALAGWPGVAWYAGGATLCHWLFGVSWDTIGAWHGLHLLCDFVHLNDRGAKLVTELLAPWLEELVSSRTPGASGGGGAS